MAKKPRKPDEVPFFDPEEHLPVHLDMGELLRNINGPAIRLDRIAAMEEVVEVPLQENGRPGKVVIALQFQLRRISLEKGAEWIVAVSPNNSLHALNATLEKSGKKGSPGREREKDLVANLGRLSAYRGARMMVWAGLLPSGETRTGYLYSSGATLDSTRKMIEAYNLRMAERHWIRTLFRRPIPHETIPNVDLWDDEETGSVIREFIITPAQGLAEELLGDWVGNDNGLRQRLRKKNVLLPRTGRTYAPIVPPSLLVDGLRDLRTEVFPEDEEK